MVLFWYSLNFIYNGKSDRATTLGVIADLYFLQQVNVKITIRSFSYEQTDLDTETSSE